MFNLVFSNKSKCHDSIAMPSSDYVAVPGLFRR